MAFIIKAGLAIKISEQERNKVRIEKIKGRNFFCMSFPIMMKIMDKRFRVAIRPLQKDQKERNTSFSFSVRVKSILEEATLWSGSSKIKVIF